MQATAHFRLERFDSVPTSARRSLLRLRGRWLAHEPARLGSPRLAVAVDGEVRRYLPLDRAEAAAVAGPDPEPWRCAFAVPADLPAAPGARFALTGVAADVELPRPVELEPGDPVGDEPVRRERRQTPDRRRPLDRRTAPSAPPAGQDRRRDSRRRTADRRRRRSQAELDAFAGKLVELETHVARMEETRSELLTAQERLQRDLEEAHAAREAAVELEARAAKAQDRVHWLEDFATDLAARALNLETEAQTAHGRVDSVETDAAQSAHRADRATAERHALVARLRELESEVEELRRRVADPPAG